MIFVGFDRAKLTMGLNQAFLEEGGSGRLKPRVCFSLADCWLPDSSCFLSQGGMVKVPLVAPTKAASRPAQDGHFRLSVLEPFCWQVLT